MNWIDLLILLLLGIGTFRGFTTGIVRQVLGIVGVILAFTIGIQLMGSVGSLLEQETGISEGFGPLIAFILIFLVLLIASRLASRMIESVLKLLKLTMVNRLAGGIFGAFQAAILVSLLFLVLAEIGLPGENARENAAFYEPVAAVFPATWDEVAGRWPRVRQISDEFSARVAAELTLEGE